MTLFTERSLLTMLHGIVLGGAFVIVFSSAVYSLWSLRAVDGLSAGWAQRHSRYLSWSTIGLAGILWLMVIIGTVIVFPSYRVEPPAGAADLALYPKALLKSNPDTAWLHSLGMEWKEHMPWIAALVMTSIAYVASRYRERLVDQPAVRNTMLLLLAIVFSVVGFIALMGIFINKQAPLF